MASLKLVYGPETRRVSKVPVNISELYAKIHDLFGVQNPNLQYKDEDNDLITIQTDEEYLDALTFSQGNLRLILNEPSVYQSVLTQSSVISQPELHTGFASNPFSEGRYNAPNNVSQEIMTEETGTHAVPVITHEFSCGTAWNVEDRACSAQIGTNEVAINTYENQDISITTQIIDLAESSSNTATFESKFVSTEPVETYSIPTATQLIEVSSKESYTELTSDKALSTVNGMKDSVFQCDIMPNQDSELISSIRFIIREELDEIKRSLSNQSVFQGTECKNCSMSPIIGSLYICSICDNYTLCEKCEEKSTHPHFFLKLKNPIHQIHLQKRKKSIPELERIQEDSPALNLEISKIYESVNLSKPQEQKISPPDEIRVSQNYSDLKLSGHINRSRPTCLDITILLDKMQEMGLKDKSINISALMKSGYQLDEAIDLALQGL